MPISPEMAQAGLAILNTGLNLAGSSIKNKKSYKYSKKLMDYQNKLNIENWNMVNEYNSPLNQRRRNLIAGINPNYGEGSLAQQIASPSGQMEADMPALGDSLMQGASMGLQMKQAKENIKLTKEQTRKTEQEADALAIDNTNKRMFDTPQRQADLNKTLREIDNLINEGKISEAKAKVADALERENVANVRASTANLQANTENTKINTLLAPKYYELEQGKLDLAGLTYDEAKRHNLALESLQSALNSAEIRKLNAEAREVEIQNALENYLLLSGLSVEKFKQEIEIAKSVIANNYDQMDKRGMKVGEVAGKVLNEVINDPLGFIKKQLKKGESILDSFKDNVLPNKFQEFKREDGWNMLRKKDGQWYLYNYKTDKEIKFDRRKHKFEDF